MSDKYEELADKFFATCKTLYYPNPLAIDRFLVIRALEFADAERAGETCKKCFYTPTCQLSRTERPGCLYWRRIVEKDG